jgi:hypothetical protein
MENQNFNSKAVYYKIALSIGLLRMKPDDLKLEEFIQNLHLQFKADYQSNREQIVELKSTILKLKQEMFMHQNKELLQQLDTEKTIELENVKRKDQLAINCDLKRKLNASLEFISSIVKLKKIGKDFKSKQGISDITSEIIFETLFTLLSQISIFFFEADLLLEENYDDEIQQIKSLYPITRETLEHAVSLFVNIFDIELVFCYCYFLF